MTPPPHNLTPFPFFSEDPAGFIEQSVAAEGPYINTRNCDAHTYLSPAQELVRTPEAVSEASAFANIMQYPTPVPYPPLVRLSQNLATRLIDGLVGLGCPTESHLQPAGSRNRLLQDRS